MMQIVPIFAIFFKKNQEYFDFWFDLQKKVLTAEFFCIILHSKSRQLHHLKKMQTFDIQCMNVYEQPAGWIEGVGKSAEER